MRSGDTVWLKIGPKYHKDIYHKFCKKTHLDPNVKLGPYIFMKLAIESVKRNPVLKS
jgi:hypothetical protein